MNPLVALEHNNPELDNQIKAEWHLGLFCNYNCTYCSTSSHSKRPDHLKFDKFKMGLYNLLAYARAQGRELRIEFTGGEPTMHPRFMEFLELTHSLNIHKISMTTNGNRPLNYYQKCAQLLESITISHHMEYNYNSENLLHKINSLNLFMKNSSVKKFLKVHIMFLPGTLTRTIEVREFLIANGIRFAIRRIRPTYQARHPENIYFPDGRLKKGTILRPFQNTSESLMLHHEDLGVDHSGGEEDYYSLEELDFIREAELRSNFANVLTYREDGKVTQESVNDISARRENQFTDWICWAGIQSLRIGVDGTLKPGNCHLPVLGNIFGDFTIAKNPSRCRNAWCSSATNLNTTKVKDNSSLQLTREGRNYAR